MRIWIQEAKILRIQRIRILGTDFTQVVFKLSSLVGNPEINKKQFGKKKLAYVRGYGRTGTYVRGYGRTGRYVRGYGRTGTNLVKLAYSLTF